MEWVENQSKLVLGYATKSHLVVKGWLVFEFLSQHDCEKIVDGCWLWGYFSLVLKR